MKYSLKTFPISDSRKFTVIYCETEFTGEIFSEIFSREPHSSEDTQNLQWLIVGTTFNRRMSVFSPLAYLSSESIVEE